MTIKEFCEKYNKLTNTELKAKCFKDIIKRQYCPVGEKYSVIKAMLDKSIVEQPNGVKYIDSFVFRMNISMAMVALYTELTLDEDVTVFENYDMAVQNHILDMIKIAITDNELKEFMSICDDLIETFDNQNSARNYIMSMVERYVTMFGMLVSNGSEKLADYLNDENKSKDLLNKLDEVLKK